MRFLLRISKRHFLCFFIFNLCTDVYTTVAQPTISDAKNRSQHEQFGKRFMITSSGEGTSRIGEEIVKIGGNVFDVFAAMSFAISVERPQSTGIGGGGFLVGYIPSFRRTSPEFVIDFRESAPLASFEKMFLDKSDRVIAGKSLDTIFAVAIPGLVKGVLDTHARFGKLPREKVMAGAVRLARDGIIVYPHLALALQERKDQIMANESAKKIFTDKEGKLLKVGDRLVQTDLANTLELIASEGEKAFYRGALSQKILAESKRLGGILSESDFSDYRVIERKPILGKFRGYEVMSMPPPSSGGVHVIQILNMVENLELSKYGQYHPFTIHMIASIMQRVFADRAAFLGDADFQKVPVAGLVSKKYAKSIVSKISRMKAASSNEVFAGEPFRYESSETTHFTIMDSDGNVLASTQTINGHFGSAIVVPDTGIILNNEMDDFAAKPGDSNLFGAIGGKNNLVEPKKRPLSSMSPTIVLKGKNAYLALGTPSGTRILTCVAQTILNVVEFQLPLYEAVAAIRYHHQWQPDQIQVDSPAFPKITRLALEKYGHKIIEKELGCKINAIMRTKRGLLGVSDPRSEGLSVGF